MIVRKVERKVRGVVLLRWSLAGGGCLFLWVLGGRERSPVTQWPSHRVRFFGAPGSRGLPLSSKRAPAQRALWPWAAIWDAANLLVPWGSRRTRLNPLAPIAPYAERIYDVRVGVREVICLVAPEIHLDERGILHRDDGPAVDWSGEGAFFWHGEWVPADLAAAPEALSAERIVSVEDEWLRQALIDRVGWERLLPIAARVHEEGEYILWHVDVPDDDPMRVLQMRDPSSGRLHFRRVPPLTETCGDGIAWTFDMEEGEYRPVAET